MRAASLLSLFAAAAVLASPVPVKNETETLAKRDSYNERWNIVDVNLDAIGVTKFRGWQNNAVASWFDTNSERDSTNGESWCWTHYHNDLPGIAISYNAMMSDGNWSNEEAGRKYCGLEVVIKTKDGRQLTAVIADAFADEWLQTPTSIDVIHGAFKYLLGWSTDDKNVVLRDVSWTFTGKRHTNWAFNAN